MQIRIIYRFAFKLIRQAAPFLRIPPPPTRHAYTSYFTVIVLVSLPQVYNTLESLRPRCSVRIIAQWLKSPL